MLLEAIKMGHRDSLMNILQESVGYVDFHPNCFWPPQPGIAESPFVVVGVPFDETTTSRPGSRYGPNAIRAASINFDTYSERSDVDLDKIKIYDLGNVSIVQGSVQESLKRVKLVISDLISANKVPIILGGEHTITYAAADAIKDALFLDFDAHMDARSEYPEGVPFTHATVMRRISDLIGPERVFQVGVRTYCREETEFARREGLGFITAYEIYKNGPSTAIDRIVEKLRDFDKVYMSIDIDVLDPPFAPGTTFPSPEGISLSTLLDMLMKATDKRLVGFDVVEVAPPYDYGDITSTNAAKLILENVALIHKARSRAID